MSLPVSIILPTYNREKDLCDIVNSVLTQSYINFEIIIINDGSSDNTASHLEMIKQKDSRIIIINKNNEGVSSSRNEGLKIARGEFIFFIDDDDEIPVNYLEKFMLPEYDNIDLIIDSFCNQLEDNIPQKNVYPPKTDNEDLMDYLLSVSNFFPFFIHAKRFKRSVIENNHIRFSENISLGEDRIFIMDYIRSKDFSSYKIINNHSYIVKSSSQAQYRLSQGHKPIDFLLNNFSATYDYLMDLHQEIKNPIVKEYADNYVAEKLMDYVLLPLSRKSTKEEIELVKSDGVNLMKRIDIKNVKKKRPWLVAKSLLSLGVSPTLTLLHFRSLF